MVIPDVQASKALGHRKQTRAKSDHELRVETELPEWLQPFTEGWTRGSSSSTDVPPPDVTIPAPALPPFAHPPAKPTSNKAGRKNNVFNHCPKTQIAKYADTRKLGERHAKKKSRRSDGQNFINNRKVWRYDNTRPQSSQWRSRIQVQDLTTQWIQSYPCKTKATQETQRSLRTFFTSGRKPKIHAHGKNYEIYRRLRRAELESWEIYSAQTRIKWNCRASCTTSERRLFVSIGSVSVGTSRKLVGRSNGVLLPSSKRARSTSRWPDTLWTTVQLIIWKAIYHQKTKIVCISSAQKSFLKYSWDTPWTRRGGEKGEKLNWWFIDSGYGRSQNNATI